jgi:hypothetical protein
MRDNGERAPFQDFLRNIHKGADGIKPAGQIKPGGGAGRD